MLRRYQSPDWDSYPPQYVGQTRRHNGRNFSAAKLCGICTTPFWPRRGQAKVCDVCRNTCSECGGRKSSKNAALCKSCRRNAPLTSKQKEQLSRLHKSIEGQNNPAKRPEVRRKIGAAISGAKHPSKKYPEKWKAHADRVRPQKVSRLENVVARWLPNWERQYKVKWYRLDFALPDKKIALEIQGCWYHNCQVCFPGSPVYKTQMLNAVNDKRKRKYLMGKGWTVLYIWAHDIEEVDRFLSLDDLFEIGDVCIP